MSFPGTILLDNGEVYKQSSTKRHPLGTRGATQDGRVFHYTKNGAVALTPAMLIQALASSADDVAEPLADSTDWTVPSTSTTLIRLSTATSMATANYFEDGYFIVTAGTTGNEVGQIVQIQSTPATTATAGPAYCPEIFLYSEDKLVTALTTSNTVSLHANPYDKVVVALDAAPTAAPVGICLTNVTASYYFWLQTWGLAPCRVSDTWFAGHNVIYASATGTREGEALPMTSLEADKGAAIVGIAQYIGTDGYVGAILLTLAP